jgi:hypothetical protein
MQVGEQHERDTWDLRPESFKTVQIFCWQHYSRADRTEVCAPTLRCVGRTRSRTLWLVQVLRRAGIAFGKLGMTAEEKRSYLEPATRYACDERA